ncbi:MAG: tRNA pseudouridine(54/55) synthase Pus10 [Planctomycetota bacterium]|nr:tRNA pseudouridine(54/55) synthase Pus10 [Planctomycetota bacterium]
MSEEKTTRKLSIEEEVEIYIDAILERAKDFEFSSFLLGAKKEVYDEDDAGLLKRTLGVRLCLCDGWLDRGRDVDWRHPDLVFILCGIKDGEAQIALKIRSIYVYGRYRKHERGISQTRWVCQKCNGKGCKKCQKQGRHYEESVQEIISAGLCPAFGSGNLGFFHGMGREDVDVLMLGHGRPFVFEILKPKVRSIDLEAFTAKFNEGNKEKVTLESLRLTNFRAPALVKGVSPDKSYRAFCKYLDTAPSPEKVKELPSAFSAQVLDQRTPQRVARRRADLIRKREVRSLVIEEEREDGLLLAIRSQSGTYIKELISSDEGRTEPSIAGFLGVPCVCAELDVLDIHISDDDALTKPEPEAESVSSGAEENGPDSALQ